jgi:hypothetical protein
MGMGKGRGNTDMERAKTNRRGLGFAIAGGAVEAIMTLIAWLWPNPPLWLRGLGVVAIIIAIAALIYGLKLIWESDRRTQREIEEKTSIIAELRQRLNVHNQRIRNLRQSLDELFYDARTKRPTENEYQATEYQTRIKACRTLATSTENSMAIERTTGVLNLIHLYVQRVQQALKEEANPNFAIAGIDTTFSYKINTELGLLLNEVQDE